MIFLPSFPICGLPGEILKRETSEKIMCLMWKSSSNLFCIILSSLIYGMVLRQRGRLGRSKIGIELRKEPQENRIFSVTQIVDSSVRSSTRNPALNGKNLNFFNKIQFIKLSFFVLFF